MKKLLLVALAVVLAGVGCRGVDLEAEREAIRSADQAWSRTPPDLDRFMDFFTEHAYAVAPDAEVLHGREEIRSLWRHFFTAPGFSLRWQATHTEVSTTGRTGFSVGTFELTIEDSAGQQVRRTGKYLTVWEKQPDGAWRVAADSAAFDSPPTED